MSTLINHLHENQINYRQLIEKCTIRYGNNHLKNEKLFFAVIIPVYNRTQFNAVVNNHFKKAIDSFSSKPIPIREKNISVTIVEHSLQPSHEEITPLWVNYIHIPMKANERFNKCLTHNVGALLNNAHNYFFHDVDVIIPDNFFTLLFDNINTQLFKYQGFNFKNSRLKNTAIQPFTGRRLLQANEPLTNRILQNGYYDFTYYFNEINQNIKAAKPGAPGGSIIVPDILFFAVGGYDAELFSEYSIEDQFFFDKLELIGNIIFCNYPSIELIHLWHPPSFGRITKKEDLHLFEIWQLMTQRKKREYIQQKSFLFHQNL